MPYFFRPLPIVSSFDDLRTLQKKKKIVNCNLFNHGALRSSLELVETCPCVPDRIGTWKCWFLRREENRSTRRKTSRGKGENQQQTQPTYGVDASIRTRATLVGGECSHHCATLAPSLTKHKLKTNPQNSAPRRLRREWWKLGLNANLAARSKTD